MISLIVFTDDYIADSLYETPLQGIGRHYRMAVRPTPPPTAGYYTLFIPYAADRCRVSAIDSSMPRAGLEPGLQVNIYLNLTHTLTHSITTAGSPLELFIEYFSLLNFLPHLKCTSISPLFFFAKLFYLNLKFCVSFLSLASFSRLFTIRLV